MSCSGACCGFRIISFQHEARIEATAGLQMSQPRPCAVLRDHVVERLQIADADQVEELLARVREVLAQVVLHVDAALLQLGVEDLLDQRAAAAAGACSPWSASSARRAWCSRRRSRRRCAPLVTLLQEQIRALAGQQVDAQALARAAFARRQDQVLGMLGQRHARSAPSAAACRSRPRRRPGSRRAADLPSPETTSFL